MEAKITCVYDEGAQENTSYIGAKGTAFIIDIGGKRVLFDTGLRHKYLLHNLEYMDIDVESFDAVVVSQACPDNCRALNGFLQQRKEPIDVYSIPGIYTGSKAGFLSNSVGITEENRPKARFHDLGDWTEVVPGVTVTPTFTYSNGYSEAFLVVDTPTLAVVSGRGVQGPGQVLDVVSQKFGRSVRAFIGSVLLEKAKKKEADRGYGMQFQDAGVTKLYLNHCTGRDGITQVRVVLGLKGVNDFYVGDVVSLK